MTLSNLGGKALRTYQRIWKYLLKIYFYVYSFRVNKIILLLSPSLHISLDLWILIFSPIFLWWVWCVWVRSKNQKGRRESKREMLKIWKVRFYNCVGEEGERQEKLDYNGTVGQGNGWMWQILFSWQPKEETVWRVCLFMRVWEKERKI